MKLFPHPALITLVIVAGSPSSVSALPAGNDGLLARAIFEDLQRLQVERAAASLGPLREAHPNDGDVLALAAYADFLQGRYQQSLTTLEQPQRPGSDTGLVRVPIREWSEASAAATRGFVVSRRGRFTVTVSPGRDELLIPLLLDVMEAAVPVIAHDLGHEPPSRVRLELYPSPETLAAVSSLTSDDIKRTGTIALCKWDRVMVTSPRALLRGYPWANVVAHELVHLILTRATGNRAPVWFQEGLAKLLERRWRGETASPSLIPATAAALVLANQRDQLIPFQRLHPSMARLDSQEEAQLAFAQVSTFMHSVLSHDGFETLRRTIDDIGNGSDAKAALERATGASWADLEARWKAGISRLPTVENPPPLPQLGFQEEHAVNDSDASNPSLDPPLSPAAGRWKRLGDLLMSRGRPMAASVEYGRAAALAPAHLSLGLRYGRASLAASATSRELLEFLEELERVHPNFAALHRLVGEVALSIGDQQTAAPAFKNAIWVNPFDPAPHCFLAELETPTLPQADRQQSRTRCQRLSVHPRQ